jgi:hypothetical protein
MLGSGTAADLDSVVRGLEKRIEDGFFAITEQMIELRAGVESDHERLDKSLHALSSGLARLERKLDRILALSVESRGRK